jgi:hypothetical protein
VARPCHRSGPRGGRRAAVPCAPRHAVPDATAATHSGHGRHTAARCHSRSGPGPCGPITLAGHEPGHRSHTIAANALGAEGRTKTRRARPRHAVGRNRRHSLTGRLACPHYRRRCRAPRGHDATFPPKVLRGLIAGRVIPGGPRSSDRGSPPGQRVVGRSSRSASTRSATAPIRRVGSTGFGMCSSYPARIALARSSSVA